MTISSCYKLLISALVQANLSIGKLCSWLVFIMAATVFILVILRSTVNIGSIASQEAVTYFHSIVFLLCMSFAALKDEHVRVDIFYRHFSSLQKAWVNAIGHILFLLPFSLFIILISWNYVLRSWGWQEAVQVWSIKEISANPAGLPYVFLLKTLIPLTGLLLALYAISDLLQKLVFICTSDHPEKQNTNKIDLHKNTDKHPND